MHTLSHFQAKKQLYIHTYTLYTYIEREEKCGIFQRNKRKESFFCLSLKTFLFASGNKRKKLLFHDGSFGFSSSLKGRIWSEKGRERERGKRPTRETCLSVCSPFNLSSVLFFVMCKDFVLRIWSLSLNQYKSRFHEMGLSLILLVS